MGVTSVAGRAEAQPGRGCGPGMPYQGRVGYRSTRAAEALFSTNERLNQSNRITY